MSATLPSAAAPGHPGIHEPRPVIGTLRGLTGRSTVLDLLAALVEQFGSGRIRLAEPLIPTSNCTVCTASCLVEATESMWMNDPRCSDCGGPWSTIATSVPDSVMELHTADELSSELTGALLENVGLRAGASVVATLSDGRSGLLRIDGDILGCVERADPVDSTAVDVTSRVAVGRGPQVHGEAGQGDRFHP